MAFLIDVVSAAGVVPPTGGWGVAEVDDPFAAVLAVCDTIGFRGFGFCLAERAFHGWPLPMLTASMMAFKRSCANSTWALIWVGVKCSPAGPRVYLAQMTS